MNKKKFKIAFCVWTVIIFTLTSIPKLHSPLHDSLNVDKLAHFIVYLIFAYLFMRMYDKSQYNKKLKFITILAFIIPVFDELHQIPIPGRSFSYYDLLADFLGFLTVMIYFRIKLKRS